MTGMGKRKGHCEETGEINETLTTGKGSEEDKDTRTGEGQRFRSSCSVRIKRPEVERGGAREKWTPEEGREGKTHEESGEKNNPIGPGCLGQ